jgi:MoxR-like ATPase
MKRRSITVSLKNKLLERALERIFTDPEDIQKRLIQVEPEPEVVYTQTSVPESSSPEVETNPEELKKRTVEKLMDFFSEFNFSPSFRFTNTLAFVTDANEYVANYFAIQDHQYAGEIAEKIKSLEFTDIISKIKNFNKPSNEINSRMKIYYGEPGTGKTTQAITEADRCVVCSSDMLPTDLMQNFAFSEGKAEFQKSDLWKAMENGEVIVLDEINMLPFESLRFLQGITDGKNELDYKGFHIEIKKGFQIIGTMNLNVGGSSNECSFTSCRQM